MRRSGWVGVIALALWLAPWAASAKPEPLRLVAGSVQQDGVTSALAASDLALPFQWDRARQGDGHASFVFELPAHDRAQAQSLYFPRVGNTFRVRWGGTLVHGSASDRPQRMNTVHIPRQVDLPPGIAPGDRIVVEIDTVAGAEGGLSTVLFGPRDEISRVYADNVHWRLAAALVVSSASLVLGMLGLLVWFHQRDAVYLFYGLAEVLWSVRTAGYYLTDRLLVPWPWWGIAMTVFYVGAITSMCYFGLLLVQRATPRWRRLFQGYLLVSAVLLAVVFAFDHHDWWRHWRATILALSLACAGLVVHSAVTRRTREAIVMSLACALIVGIGARDWVVITLQGTNYNAFPWVTYAWVGFGFVMALLLAWRLREATRAQEAHAQELAVRLAQQEQALERAFAETRVQTAHTAATEERTRVLQDMHDGVGHELLGALQIAHEDETPREVLAQQIQRAMDHLKLTVDVLQEGAQDISTVLGLLRYRLGPRLQAAGITLDWQVDTIPAVEGWTTRHSRDLQMLLYEAFTNLLAHAHAKRIRLSARHEGECIRIRLEDDGRGVAADAKVGQGRQTMASRAARLGGTLRIGNGEGPQLRGAVVELEIACDAGARGGLSALAARG